MLSRDHVIHRSAGEEREARLDRAGAQAGNAALLRAKTWTKLVLIFLTVGILGAFVLLNRSAVVEPRLHLVLFQSDRPALLTVLLLTSLASAVGALLVRATVVDIVRRPHRFRPSPSERRQAHAAAPAPAVAGAAPSP
jgi:hypothetical protein